MYRKCIIEYTEKISLYREYTHRNRRFNMKYTKEQRIKIGRQIYEGELTRYDAAEKYSISYHTAKII